MRSLGHSAFHAILQLDDLRLLLNKTYGLRLMAKGLFSKDNVNKNVKQFCGELLDRGVPNHWKTTLRASHSSLRVRASVASSLFSLRKMIGGDKPCPLSYAKRMSESSPELDPDFAIFCSQEMSRQFSHGWDRGYWNNVDHFTPPTKSNRDAKEKGTYRKQAVDGGLPREGFLRWSGGTVCDPLDRLVRAKAVLTGGKWRVITLSEPKLANLLPLHQTIYNWLSRKDWLLRGEATPDRFREFGRTKGEIIVSGDYEGATDNLNVNLSRLILRRLLSSATHIPTRVREEAMRSLTMGFLLKDGSIIGHNRGQLMGSPLSFPLLCLCNYLTFKYAVRREVPVKINGDDIVFKCRPDERDQWFAFVGKSGLVVSPGKTLVHKTLFSLNSTYFLSSDSGAQSVPHFRTSCLYRKCEDVGALAGRVAQIKRDLAVGEIRCAAISILLRKNLSLLYSSQGSLSRRYLCPVPNRVLRALRLVERESFYRGLPSEPAPLPSYSGFKQDVIPTNWKKQDIVYHGERRVPEDEVAKVFTLSSWTGAITSETKDEYFARLRDGSFRYVPFAKKTFKLFRKFVGSSFAPSSYPAFHTKEKFWVERPSGGIPRGPVDFRSGGFLA